MIGAHFHLSRPYFSFLAILNFRTSWLSREIVFTILFFLTTGYLWYLQWFDRGSPPLKDALGWIALAFGFAATYCMSSIYLLPTQTAWNTPITILSFYVTTLLLGVMTTACLLIMDLKFAEAREPATVEARNTIIHKALVWFVGLTIVGLLGAVAISLYQIAHLSAGDETAQISLQLLLQVYQALIGMRFILVITGIGTLAICAYLLNRRNRPATEMMVPVYLACLLVMVGEIIGRFLLYATHVRVGI
jgi:anaerobic dimethyl sulfoxide reductase subunit C (anchor subunit)